MGIETGFHPGLTKFDMGTVFFQVGLLDLFDRLPVGGFRLSGFSRGAATPKNQEDGCQQRQASAVEHEKIGTHIFYF